MRDARRDAESAEGKKEEEGSGKLGEGRRQKWEEGREEDRRIS